VIQLLLRYNRRIGNIPNGKHLRVGLAIPWPGKYGLEEFS
jgi:hypothetical protein